jgi:BirA family biotin operon repressor/biotin-[acetyl-CoA-carboxylase] ligase
MIRGAPSGIAGLRAVAHAWSGAVAARRGARPNLLLAASVDSTQRWARALLERMLADDDEPETYCSAALVQTAGRGRDQRSWSSRSGGVYATIVCRLGGEEELQSLPARIAIALAGAVNPIVGGTCRIKWPNDLVVGRRKIGGILIDALTPADAAPWALVGFGLNHSQRDFGDAREVATSLAEEVGLRLPYFEEFFAVALAAASDAATASPVDGWIEELRALSAHVEGDTIRARLGDRAVEGSFAGFDEHGFLVVDTAAGREVIRSGEVFAW